MRSQIATTSLSLPGKKGLAAGYPGKAAQGGA
jgi:hypothetical protein